MEQVTTGRVWLGSDEISGMNEKELTQIRKKKMGFVFQGINLISNLNVYENIISPTYKTGMKRREREERAQYWLEKMEIEQHSHKFPSQLSGGQRQRVAICRALINRPDVLFADEPTGALNQAQAQNVMDIFDNIHREGQSIVMVTHDLKAALHGNRILYINDGRIDGELTIGEYGTDDICEREDHVYKFLKSKGW